MEGTEMALKENVHRWTAAFLCWIWSCSLMWWYPGSPTCPIWKPLLHGVGRKLEPGRSSHACSHADPWYKPVCLQFSACCLSTWYTWVYHPNFKSHKNNCAENMPKGLQLNTPSLMVSKCIVREDQEQDKHTWYSAQGSLLTHNYFPWDMSLLWIV